MRKRWNLTRPLAVVAIIAFGAVATAYPPYLERFKATYPIKEGTPLAAAKCATCHTGPSGGARNPFGRAITAKRTAAGTMQLTEAVLKGLDPEDSDADGASNKDEIAAGTLPGDSKSKPAPVGTPKTDVPTPEPAADLVPKHSFHPLIVHFPIGLFLFGVFLEALGIRKRNETLRQAAFWNLAAGALSGLVSIPTGLIAAFRIPYELTPGTPVFNHLIGGILATILMVIVVAWRRKASPESPAYLTTLLLAAGLVVAAGHFGGALVYG